MVKAHEQKRINRETLTRSVEVAADILKDSPVGRLSQRFKDIRQHRQPFLDEASNMAELVVPGMYEGSAADGGMSSGSALFGLETFVSANQSLIAKGCLLLAWTIASVVLPVGGNYFGRSVEESVAQELEALEEMRKQQSQMLGQAGDPPDFVPIGEQINNELLTDDIIIRKHIASSNHQEVFAACMLHSIISGLSVFGHLSLEEAKTYTIQNCAVVFDSSHSAVEVIVVDRVPLVNFDESVRNRVVGAISLDKLKDIPVQEQLVTVYTQQIRTSQDRLEVFTEIEGIDIPELKVSVPANEPVFYPLPFMFLNEADPYPIGWLTFNRGDCFEYENLNLAVSAMIEACRKCVIGLPSSAGITPQELEEGPDLQVIPVSDQKARLEAIVAPIAANLQQVREWHNVKERGLQITFGMDFAVQRPGERVTAEEITSLLRGLQRLFGSTYKQIERTFQKNHINRQFSLASDKGLVREVDPTLFTMSLTTGVQEQEAQDEISKMDQVLTRMQMFGEAGLQRANIDTVLNWYGHRFKVDMKNKLLNPEEVAEQLGIGQLLTTVRQLGPQAPGMLAQLLQKATGQGDTSNEPASPQTAA